MTVHDAHATSRVSSLLRPPRSFVSPLISLPCDGGPLHGELRECSEDHVLWCLANGGAAGRPTVVLLHASVTTEPVVIESLIGTPDAMGYYRADMERRVLRWMGKPAE